jgi:mannose-6-phosphate isomerase-like protein (cupin superfamily)
MKRAHLRFGKGFHVVMSNRRAQVATMTLTNGDSEGDSRNRASRRGSMLVRGAGTGTARVNGKAYPLRPGTMVLIEHGDRHEIIAGRGRLETLNIYVPPAYTGGGEELPRAKR